MMSLFYKKIAVLFFVLVVFSVVRAQTNPSDACTGVPSLSVNSTCVANSYTLAGSYTDGALIAASCNGNLNRDDGWYSFTATGTTTDIDLTGNRDHTLAVWSACGGGTELACDYATSGNVATISMTTVIGTTYYVQVWRNSSNNGSSMTGTICIHDPIVQATDCSAAVQVCSNTAFPGNSSGFGTQELNATNRGCLNGNEHQSSWYVVSIGTTGTFQMMIAPTVTSDDYDFAVWGPASACPPSGTPIRCSYSGTTGNTGINTGLNGAESPQTSEGSGGNKYVDDLNVTAGDVYLVCIDNFNSTTTTFNLTFGGSAGISCVPLPVELIEFTAENVNGVNVVEWVTKSESNNDFFTLQRSEDGENWQDIVISDAAGNSNSELRYTYRDYYTNSSWLYYQLWQTDFDGMVTNLGIVAVNNGEQEVQLVRIINLMGEVVDENYPGIQVYIYSDGTSVKRIKQY